MNPHDRKTLERLDAPEIERDRRKALADHPMAKVCGSCALPGTLRDFPRFGKTCLSCGGTGPRKSRPAKKPPRVTYRIPRPEPYVPESLRSGRRAGSKGKWVAA